MIGRTIQHYKILEKLGGGGMGVVYKAEDIKLKRLVALKFLPPYLTEDNEAKKRLIIEAQAASSLDHPNICTIHEINETEDGRLYMAMALYDGETLQEKIDKSLLTIDETIETTLQICEGLEKAHTKNIIHRDLKPPNIMITSEGRVKILDFGLAKLSGNSKLTKEGTTLGTTKYISPEQIRGERADERSDIWALGVILYEMISGDTPFNGEYEQAVIYSIINEEPKQFSGLIVRVPIKLEKIVNKCLSKSPSERYQHVNELITDLEELTQKTGTSQSIKYPAKTPSNKKLRYYILGGFIVLLLVIAGVFYFNGEERKTINSIAILPLANLSNEEDQNYFVQGMHEALITELSQITALRVISRQSVLRYRETEKSVPEIARELDIDAILQGSVLKIGEKIRISAQLVSIEPERNLWAKTYDSNLQNILALYSNVASSIAEEIQVKITPEQEARLVNRPQVKPEAYNAYLLGRNQYERFTKDGFESSVKYFRESIEMDSTFALAYALLGESYAWAGFYNWVSVNEARLQAEAAAKKGLALDKNLGEAYLAMATIQYLLNWNFDEAEKEFKHAIGLTSNPIVFHQYGIFLSVVGRHEEAIKMLEKALELDPLSALIHCDLTWRLWEAGYDDRAISQAQITIELDSTLAETYWTLSWIYANKKLYDKALKNIKIDERMYGGQRFGPHGYVYAVSGNKLKAEKYLKELEDLQKTGTSVYTAISMIYLGLGQIDLAFKNFQEAVDRRESLSVWFQATPLWKPYHSDPRFIEILEKVGRTHEW
jgi:serine/threonine protein kinase